MRNNVQTQPQTDLETQLKASRDVANAMAAKSKVQLRELKTVKADLAFAKERCAQLEEENRILRESRDKGGNPEDDDLIRLQLETLLAEKARLAQENSVLTRENRFLREIVEYHQLTMQDVVYLDETNEEVTEVYPIKVHASTNLLLFNSTLLSSSAHLFLPIPD
nr:Chromosome partition protein like [Ipomoea batatas]